MSDKSSYPSTLADKVLVRMPDGMRDRLKDAAKDNNRTMNAEIVARLEGSFRQAPPVVVSGDDMRNLLETDPAMQKIFSDQMYRASMDLVRGNPEFKQEMQDLLAAALIVGKARSVLAEDAAADIAGEDVLKDIKQGRQSQAKKKPPADH